MQILESLLTESTTHFSFYHDYPIHDKPFLYDFSLNVLNGKETHDQ